MTKAQNFSEVTTMCDDCFSPAACAAIGSCPRDETAEALIRADQAHDEAHARSIQLAATVLMTAAITFALTATLIFIILR